MSFSWTDDAVTELRKCVAANFSAGVTSIRLSNRFGDISRNGVVGKARRLKLKFNGGPGGRPDHGRASVRAQGRLPRPRAPKAWKPPKTTRPAPPPAAEPAGAHRCDLMGLTNASCRWPVTAEPPHWFCGEPTADMIGGRAYCPYHAKRSTDKSRDYGVAA